MNELQIFQNEEFDQLSAIEANKKDPLMGFFYVLELDSMVKIGCSAHPRKRAMDLVRTIHAYSSHKVGRIAISVPHFNYAENEKNLHKAFSSVRKASSELFYIDFDTVVSEAQQHVHYIFDFNDNSEELVEFIKEALGLKGYRDTPTDQVLAAAVCSLSDENRMLREEIDFVKDKILYSDVMATMSISIPYLHTILEQNGLDIAYQQLLNFLRDNGYLMSDQDSVLPTQHSIDLDLMDVDETVVNHCEGFIEITRTTKITGKGQQYFINLFLSDKK